MLPNNNNKKPFNNNQPSESSRKVNEKNHSRAASKSPSHPSEETKEHQFRLKKRNNSTDANRHESDDNIKVKEHIYKALNTVNKEINVKTADGNEKEPFANNRQGLTNFINKKDKGDLYSVKNYKVQLPQPQKVSGRQNKMMELDNLIDNIALLKKNNNTPKNNEKSEMSRLMMLTRNEDKPLDPGQVIAQERVREREPERVIYHCNTNEDKGLKLTDRDSRNNNQQYDQGINKQNIISFSHNNTQNNENNKAEAYEFNESSANRTPSNNDNSYTGNMQFFNNEVDEDDYHHHSNNEAEIPSIKQNPSSDRFTNSGSNSNLNNTTPHPTTYKNSYTKQQMARTINKSQSPIKDVIIAINHLSKPIPKNHSNLLKSLSKDNIIKFKQDSKDMINLTELNLTSLLNLLQSKDNEIAKLKTNATSSRSNQRDEPSRHASNQALNEKMVRNGTGATTAGTVNLSLSPMNNDKKALKANKAFYQIQKDYNDIANSKPENIEQELEQTKSLLKLLMKRYQEDINRYELITKGFFEDNDINFLI